MIDTVIFDFGCVLIDWNPRYMYSKVFSDTAEMENFLTEVNYSKWNELLDIDVPFDDVIAMGIKDYPQYAQYIPYYKTRWMDMVKSEITGSVEILRSCKEHGYKTYGLSNMGSIVMGLLEEKYPFFSELDGKVISAEIKSAKPDEKIYRTLLEKYSINPANAVFIDDVKANIDTAISLGLKGIVFQNPEQVKAELKKMGIEI